MLDFTQSHQQQRRYRHSKATSPVAMVRIEGSEDRQTTTWLQASFEACLSTQAKWQSFHHPLPCVCYQESQFVEMDKTLVCYVTWQSIKNESLISFHTHKSTITIKCQSATSVEWMTTSSQPMARVSDISIPTAILHDSFPHALSWLTILSFLVGKLYLTISRGSFPMHENLCHIVKCHRLQ